MTQARPITRSRSASNGMRKAVVKRIKVTKTGKLLRRRAGQNHFNAKSSRKTQLRNKKSVAFSGTWEKKMNRYF